MTLFTIGFTQTSAEDFFKRLKEARVQRVLDVRLNNVSQLAGFAKKSDLKFFLKSLCKISYEHHPMLAPTQEMLLEFKVKKGDWSIFEKKYLKLLTERKIEKSLPKELIDQACLLCSEAKPHICHRRLLAEYLKRNWKKLEVVHL